MGIHEDGEGGNMWGGGVSTIQIEEVVANYLTENPPTVEAVDPRSWHAQVGIDNALWSIADDPQPEFVPLPSGVPVLAFTSVPDLSSGPLIGDPAIYLTAGAGEMAELVEDLTAIDRAGDTVVCDGILDSVGYTTGGEILLVTANGTSCFGVYHPINRRQAQSLADYFAMRAPAVIPVYESGDVPDTVTTGTAYLCNPSGGSFTMTLPDHGGELQGVIVYFVNTGVGGIGAPTVTVEATGWDSGYIVEGAVNVSHPQWALAQGGTGGGWTITRITEDPNPANPGDWWNIGTFNGIRGQLDELAARATAAMPELRFFNPSNAVDHVWNGDKMFEVWDLDSGDGDGIEPVISYGDDGDGIVRRGRIVWAHHRAGSATCTVRAQQSDASYDTATLALGEAQMFVLNETGWVQASGALG